MCIYMYVLTYILTPWSRVLLEKLAIYIYIYTHTHTHKHTHIYRIYVVYNIYLHGMLRDDLYHILLNVVSLRILLR